MISKAGKGGQEYLRLGLWGWQAVWQVGAPRWQSKAKSRQLLKLKVQMGPGRLTWESQTQAKPEMLSQPLITCPLPAFQNIINTCWPKSTCTTSGL